MEADWEVEIGPDAAVIDASWPGFIDLKLAPERIGELEEARRFPPFAETLLRLNEAGSPVWTAKCDLWSPEEWDPYELDAAPEASGAGLACYIDILPEDSFIFAGFGPMEAWVRSLVSRIRLAAGRCCRVDLVIRRAVTAELEGLGVTAYITACGADPVRAEENLHAALAALADAIAGTTSPDGAIG